MVTRGFSNWKDGTRSFKNHESSAAHQEAVNMVITIPSTHQDIGRQLSKQFATQKKNNTHALYQIFSSIKFLCRQGLPLRGDSTEIDGNIQQLLKMKAAEDPILSDWLKRKENVYKSPEIQN